MKRLTVVVILLCLTTVIPAQSPIERGSYTINGSITYSSESYNNISSSYSIFIFNPQFGYFFVDKLYTAVSLTLRSYSSGGTSTTLYGIGPSFRYYFDNNKVKPFAGAAFNYLVQSTGGESNSSTNTEFKLTGGLDYFISSDVALEATINYSFIHFSYPGGYYSSDSYSSKLFQLGIGVNYFIF